MFEPTITEFFLAISVTISFAIGGYFGYESGYIQGKSDEFERRMDED